MSDLTKIDISPETALALYYEMLRIRLIEERIAELYMEREMRCPVHLCVGQEAVSVGVCAVLDSTDYVLSNHRSHGHYLAKGGDLKAMMAELYGKVTGCSLGIGGSMHLVDLSVGFQGSSSIVGSTIPIAAGMSLGSVMQNKKQATVVFLGDGATEEGIFHESLNFSVLKNLPVIYVCENNFYSVYSPISVRQPGVREIYELAKGHGMASYQGDGNDVLEVYRLAKQAVLKAKERAGPTFLEFKTYRWRTHCGGKYDNDLGYRSQNEFEEWKRCCPVDRLKSFLFENSLPTKERVQEMTAKIETEIEEAVTYAKESAHPDESLLLTHIYAT